MDGFDNWVAGFRTKAYRQGISAAGFDRSFQGVSYNSEVIAKDRNQPEYAQTVWDYLDRAVSDTRIENARLKLCENEEKWAKVEDQFGVKREIIAAIWGLESAYGEVRGEFPVIEALATLAFDGRRKGLFENQLVAALKIIHRGHICATQMIGSWAGAMGHTQFMPSSYLQHAIDFDGDGRCDIWGDEPWDALASTAAYLAGSGWQSGRPWGLEVSIDSVDQFDFEQCGTGIKKSTFEWAELGISSVAGGDIRNHGPASVLFPAGVNGPAFMVFNNFQTLLQYNGAIPYGLAVGHLSDRIAGGFAFTASWPRSDKQLSRKERRELQERLSSAGFETKGADGVFGPNTFAALRSWQKEESSIADGYPTMEILERLRNKNCAAD